MVEGAIVTDVREGFREFYSAELPALRRLAYRLTGDWSDAEDLAQEAMVRTYRAWKRIAERPEVYARAVLVNRHRSLLRRALVEARHLGSRRELNSHEVPDDALAIWDELAHLPIKQRQAIVLHFYEGRPQTEIASILGCAPGTVNSLVYRGLERLRARLGNVELIPDGDLA